MTGKELIIYILQNNLEDTEVLTDNGFTIFMNEQEAAAKFGVGVETVRSWYLMNMLPGIRMADSIFIVKNATDPMERK